MNARERAAQKGLITRQHNKDFSNHYLAGFKAGRIINDPDYQHHVDRGMRVPTVPKFDFSADKSHMIRRGIASAFAGNRREIGAVRKYNKDQNSLMRDALNIGSLAPGGLGKGKKGEAKKTKAAIRTMIAELRRVKKEQFGRLVMPKPPRAPMSNNRAAYARHAKEQWAAAKAAAGGGKLDSKDVMRQIAQSWQAAKPPRNP